MNKILENEIDLLPESPGVYLMKNALDKVIYVGKAKILKNRVSQYFLRPQVGKVRRMVNEVDHFETIQTATEKEALLLEINLIRKYYPRYNILLKDGKSYPYIALKKDSEAPILKIKHNDTDKTYKYFGPFPNAGACYEVIDLLNRIYPLRKCSTLQKNVCLYYHIGSCLGPCIHKIEPSIYQKYMDEIESFLNGKDQTKIKEYERLMKEESSNLNFEKAAEYKKIIDSINHVIDHQVIDSSTEKVDRDVFGVSLRDGYLALAVLTYKKGRLLGKELFVVEEFDDFNEQMTELIVQYYSNNNHKIPNEIFVSNKEIVDILTISLNTKVFSPTSGNKMELIDLCIKNAKNGLDEHFQTARLEDDKNKLLEELGSLLNISTPFRIELFDNSHLQGSDAIGAMVCFINGEKAKKMYRKFIIQHDEKRDDFASMKEVIKRRYERLKNENKDFPDLILVDGGENQITAAKEALKEINIAIPLAGLYKDNKHNTKGLINENYEIINIEEKTPLYFMLVRMQDEVHRFAIRFHRESRSKSMFNSYFDNIDGLGERRKQILLERYPSLNDIRVATTEELAQLVPIEVAKRIKEKIT